jgi:hypothetical protein
MREELTNEGEIAEVFNQYFKSKINDMKANIVQEYV